MRRCEKNQKNAECPHAWRMARGRYRFKLCDLPVFPTLGLVFGSLALVVILLSVFKRHLLEVQSFYEIWDHPVPVQEEKNITAKSKPLFKQPWESTSVEGVPKGGDSRLREVWNSSTSEYYYACTTPSKKYLPATSKTGQNGYMLTDANGDLFLQRAGISDFVAIARILDVTMAVPFLTHKHDDHDTSNFSDVFDVDHFISSLSEHVRIVKQLPSDVKLEDRVSLFVPPRKSSAIWYEVKLLHELQTKNVVRFTQTDYRLQDNLDPDLQKLRCRANYEALRFAPPIAALGQTMVQRMRAKNKFGRYIAVHIRFDQELLSSSGCYFGGGDKERKDLRVFRRQYRTSYHRKDPHKERREGRCPLTPMEVGLLLRAMGFGEKNPLYIVMGEVYGGEETLAPLKKLFPNHYTRNTLAEDGELAPFQPYPSQLAAIDYTICEKSDAFVANDNGDMARVTAGHRRFDGHKRTIRPNFQKLALLYVARHNLGWYQFASKLRIFQDGLIGEPREKSRTGEFYEVPTACICAKGQFEFIKTAHEGREMIKRIHRLKRNGTADELDPEIIEMEEEREREKVNQSGETIAEEMLNIGINQSLVLDEDEDAEIPEDWPWIMN